MSNLSNAPVRRGTELFNIVTFSGQLLQVKSDGTISLNAKLELAGDDSVQFYVDISRLFNTTQQLVFFIRPKNNSTKYVAVSGKSLVLKEANKVSDNSHRFLVTEPDDSDYKKLQTNASSLSTSPMFITDAQNGTVVIAGDTNTACLLRLIDTQTTVKTSNTTFVFSTFEEIEMVVSEE